MLLLKNALHWRVGWEKHPSVLLIEKCKASYGCVKDFCKGKSNFTAADSRRGNRMRVEGRFFFKKPLLFEFWNHVHVTFFKVLKRHFKITSRGLGSNSPALWYTPPDAVPQGGAGRRCGPVVTAPGDARGSWQLSSRWGPDKTNNSRGVATVQNYVRVTF